METPKSTANKRKETEQMKSNCNRNIALEGKQQTFNLFGGGCGSGGEGKEESLNLILWISNLCP